MDPLDDVFAAMHLNSALYSRLVAGAPWGVSFVKSGSIRFGFMIDGQGWLDVAGEEAPIRLKKGEGFIVQPDTLFSLRDAPRTPTLWCEEIFAECAGTTASFGGEGDEAEIMCGYFTFDKAGAAPLLSILPRVVILAADERRSPLLQSAFELLALETAQENLGARIVISRLADIVFIQAIRAHCLRAQPHHGWIAGLTDAKLGHAIRQMHQHIAHPWTVDELAELAGMSRSAFSARFKSVTGDTPLGYLTHWRMYRARCLLRQPALPLSAIAERVGYDSAVTLGRAFKRFQGQTPGDYRKSALC
ncbi:AraC family transcriptional regulator [Affinibrenneria salicis]|uniref:AraC family transcriptional regulator n=1 Tax=Affinibrenneria salicis TaxID=2590031 RepID=A0A5J5G1A2_9GAMM|nr:AraC family transcriptional regulator [Affinibrenneria salicis]KAA9000124.1 AraC family transcriptional regulator [Affinibrenneria salicis]